MDKYEYAIFDLDGTILDTSEGIILAISQTLREYNRQIPDRKTLEKFIGPPIQNSFQTLYNLSDIEAMKMANVFRNHYMCDKFLLKAVPYNGIFDLMDKLISSGVKIGIATYKREDYARRLLCAKGFGYYTEHMYGSDFDGRLKKKEIIRNCLEKMNCDDYGKAVYIGDSKGDADAATEVGIDFVAVTYGFGFKGAGEIPSAVHVCNTVRELMLIIEKYKGSSIAAIKSFASGLERDINAVENAVASELSNGFV